MRTRLSVALLSAMQNQKLTQEQLANRSGLSQPTITTLISGRCRISIPTLRKLTNALDRQTNASVLISHLEDEIERAGHHTTDYDIRHNPKKYSGKKEKAVEYISSRINTDPDLAALIISIYDMLNPAEKSIMIAAESKDTYGK